MKNLKGTLAVLILWALFITGLPGVVFGYDLEGKVLTHTLKNGIKVLMMERHLSPTVSLYIRHRVGAVDEPDGKTGMAHFLEHMMFKGTKTIGTKNYGEEAKIIREMAKVGDALDEEKRKGNRANLDRLQKLSRQLAKLQKEQGRWIVSNELDQLYTENGGLDMNASTGQDLTTYHVSLPANKLELWARIESDRMMNPVLREFYSEREVVMEERRQRVDSTPDGKLMEQFYAAAFTTHPYRRPIVGWPSDIPFLNMSDMKTFLKKTNAPEKTVIAVVGDIDPSATLKLLVRYFGKIPRQNSNTGPAFREPTQTKERRLEVLFDANPRLVMGFHKPTLPSFDDYVFDVIESILGKGRTSRLHRRLVQEKGLAETVSVAGSRPGSRYPNLFVLYATPRSPHSLEELESTIVMEIERIRTEPVSEKELAKVKNQIKADFIRGLATNAGLASSLSYFESMAGDFRYMTRHSTMIERITRDDILRVAKQYLIKENRTIAVLKRPEGPSRVTEKGMNP